ncbi:MAG TPA: Rrf2 family transcriptional regulator [Acetivibrio sp.]|jgi:Rrf2 family cysteine metabolism transcriptional repressor|nr:Rrf2 family transcriptional regulator [Clostridium sp.]HOQ37398.1 Rrf2 family transcriptional regulator [Acetivibrio sp.]HPT91430.1 Rrf2 family transcriptional regulator [Acetivibrio sp.]HQA58063.1 Rrf2 family transcriptional regulator [Acetivibrio sp.]
MKLTTKGRYGVKAMIDLALQGSEEPVSLKSIAERQNLSENYLEQLFAVLKKSGLVKSVRGAQGGYLLAGNPADITIGSILRSLEGSLAPVDCVLEEDPVKCDKSDSCITKFVWEKIRDSVNSVVDSITLADLIAEYKKKNDAKDCTSNT